MSRVQLALRVTDLNASIDFYAKLFGTRPAKIRDGYANFAVAEPPLKLVLIEGPDAEGPDAEGRDAEGRDAEQTRLDHLGVEVEDSGQVTDAAQRLHDAGLATQEENDTACCYALQHKVWVTGPGNEPWEVYAVKADADTLTKTTNQADDSACCTPAATTAETAETQDPQTAVGTGCC